MSAFGSLYFGQYASEVSAPASPAADTDVLIRVVRPARAPERPRPLPGLRYLFRAVAVVAVTGRMVSALGRATRTPPIGPVDFLAAVPDQLPVTRPIDLPPVPESPRPREARVRVRGHAPMHGVIRSSVSRTVAMRGAVDLSGRLMSSRILVAEALIERLAELERIRREQDARITILERDRRDREALLAIWEALD